MRKLATGYDPFTIACALNIMGFFFFNIVAVARHGTAGTLSVFFSPFTDATFVITILFLGVFCSLITSLLTAYALKTLPAVHVGLFNNVGTIVSVLAGTIFLDEAFFWYHFVGIVAILAGTVSFNLTSGKK